MKADVIAKPLEMADEHTRHYSHHISNDTYVNWRVETENLQNLLSPDLPIQNDLSIVTCAARVRKEISI